MSVKIAFGLQWTKCLFNMGLFSTVHETTKFIESDRNVGCKCIFSHANGQLSCLIDDYRLELANFVFPKKDFWNKTFLVTVKVPTSAKGYKQGCRTFNGGSDPLILVG